MNGAVGEGLYRTNWGNAMYHLAGFGMQSLREWSGFWYPDLESLGSDWQTA